MLCDLLARCKSAYTALMSLRSKCPIAGALDLFGDRWTLLVMRDALFYDKRRFADFLASPEGIATNVLADRLARLERCGLLERRPYLDRPHREEYHPTDRGSDLVPVLRELIRWGKRHVRGTARRPPASMRAVRAPRTATRSAR
jgi:DNA-binding HxlR family transcriptional regulator